MKATPRSHRLKTSHSRVNVLVLSLIFVLWATAGWAQCGPETVQGQIPVGTRVVSTVTAPNIAECITAGQGGTIVCNCYVPEEGKPERYLIDWDEPINCGAQDEWPVQCPGIFASRPGSLEWAYRDQFRGATICLIDTTQIEWDLSACEYGAATKTVKALPRSGPGLGRKLLSFLLP